MADKSQLSTEAVSNELERLRQQKRSFALQRAEGLIDAELQHDLVADLDVRIATLEEQLKQAGTSNSDVSAESETVDTTQVDDDNAVVDVDGSPKTVTDKPEQTESTFVDEMVAEDETGEKTEEDTHDHPEVEPVTDASDAAAHGEAIAVDEIMANTTTTAHVVDTSKQATASTVAEVPAISDESPETATDEPQHAETTFVDEMVAEDESGEKTDEDTHDHPEAEPVTVTSDKPEHGEAIAIDEIMANTTTTAQVVDTSKQAAAPTVAEVPVIDIAEDNDKDNADVPEEPEPIEDQVVDDLIIEEEQHPIRHENEGVIKFTKLVDDVVVSSAMVKEPDYLDSIHEPNVVDIRDITKTYKMGEFELEVLKGVTLQVQKGEFISIMGPSGSGKSTLMNILGALDKPTSGEYFLDATDVSKMNEKQLAEVRNSKIGFVFQSFNLLKRTSALRQVELPLIYGTHKDRTRRAREALEAVGLGQRLDHTPAELSGGQQQRVAIARALVTEPSLILADEPTGNLDTRSGNDVMQIFQKMNRENNITTIFVTHDPWIARHTDRVIMLRDGNIIADQRVKNPLIAGEAERPSEAEELQAIFENTYYGGDEEEYT